MPPKKFLEIFFQIFNAVDAMSARQSPIYFGWKKKASRGKLFGFNRNFWRWRLPQIQNFDLTFKIIHSASVISIENIWQSTFRVFKKRKNFPTIASLVSKNDAIFILKILQAKGQSSKRFNFGCVESKVWLNLIGLQINCDAKQKISNFSNDDGLINFRFLI